MLSFGMARKLPALPDGYMATETAQGRVVHPKSVNPAAVKKYARTQTLDVIDMVDADGRMMAEPRPAPAGAFTTLWMWSMRSKVLSRAGDVSRSCVKVCPIF